MKTNRTNDKDDQTHNVKLNDNKSKSKGKSQNQKLKIKKLNSFFVSRFSFLEPWSTKEDQRMHIIQTNFPENPRVLPSPIASRLIC